MKTARSSYVVFGILLVLAGVIALLEINGVIPSFDSALWQWLGPALFALGGLALLALFLTRPRDRWPAAIGGFVLLSLGVVAFFGEQLDQWAGPVFLGGIGLAFLLVYGARRELWWALIPAGSLLTLAVVAALDAQPGVNSDVPGAVFFFGLAATFLAVFATRGPAGRRKWALVPALILAAMGVIVSLVAAGVLDTDAAWWPYLGPAVLILIGLFLMYKAVTRKEKPASPEKPPAIQG